MDFDARKIVDIQAISERFDDDLELLNDLIILFTSDLDMYLNKIEVAISNKDGTELRHNSHALKGAIVNFEAERAKLVVQKLELKGKNNEFDETENLVESLKEEINKFVKIIKNYVANN